MRNEIRNTLRKIRSLDARRAHLIDVLARDEPLLIGSLSHVNRTCGKPSCHCARTPAHPAWTLATTTDGQRRCQVVRLADVAEVRRRVATYKAFKQLLRDFDAIESELAALLRGLMEARNLPYA